jgi:capsular exopolysaccharide synthesis family protein
MALKSARVELAVRRAERDQTLAERGEVAARRLDGEVNRLERTVAILEEQNLAEKRMTLDELEKRIDAMQISIPSWESKVLDMNDRLAKSQRLKENVLREQGYYDHLLGTLQNVDLSKNVQQERLSVLQAATPGHPEKRYLPMRIALAVIFGLFLSLGIVFAWYLLDDRFVSFRDIKDQFGETLLGLVPQIKVPRAKPQAALLENRDSRPAYVESYRHLRSALLLSTTGENRTRTLLITSSAPAEGKTTISVNLARLLARSGLRVVLMDADARSGGMNRLLGGQNQPGLLDYLRGDADSKAVIHPTEFDGLSFVPGGTHNEHAEGLFLRPRLAELIRELRQNRDFVILDGAPILASDDAALLVPQSDMVILVARPFYTRSRLVRQALDMLYQRQAKQVAIILNRARAEDLAGHYAVNGMARPAKNGKV